MASGGIGGEGAGEDVHHGLWGADGAVAGGVDEAERDVARDEHGRLAGPSHLVGDAHARGGHLVDLRGDLQDVVVAGRAVVVHGEVDDGFLAGYGAAQAVPGPLFTFAAYLGAVMGPEPNGWPGAALALGATVQLARRRPFALHAAPLAYILTSTKIRWVVKHGEVYEGLTLKQVWPQERALPRMFWETSQ